MIEAHRRCIRDSCRDRLTVRLIRKEELSNCGVLNADPASGELPS